MTLAVLITRGAKGPINGSCSLLCICDCLTFSVIEIMYAVYVVASIKASAYLPTLYITIDSRER
jgi:hypothetical protein